MIIKLTTLPNARLNKEVGDVLCGSGGREICANQHLHTPPKDIYKVNKDGEMAIFGPVEAARDNAKRVCVWCCRYRIYCIVFSLRKQPNPLRELACQPNTISFVVTAKKHLTMILVDFGTARLFQKRASHFEEERNRA